MQVNAGDGRLHQSHRRNLTKALVSLLALSLAPIAATASTVAPDCPLGNEAYSVDSPLIDILLDPAATAALRAEPGFARFLDGAQPMLLHTEAPSFGAIVSPRFLIGWAQLSADVLPAIDSWRPQLIFISAGFDAHAEDPLASMALFEEDFIWVTRELCALAERHCDGKIVSVLEGGYDPAALARSVVAHLKVLAEERA